MAQFLGFGDGHDGAVPTSGTINSYATMTGSSGSTTVTTSLSVSVGDLVLLHQTRTNSYGTWEVVKVASTGSGQFTAADSLVNSYASGAQAVLIPQYTSGTISGTISGTAYAGSTGGIITFAANGAVTISGTINGNTIGFRGQSGVSGGGSVGRQGEGVNGNGGSQTTSANINAGGGGGYSTNNPWNQGNGGGGGGNGGAGAGGRGTGGGQNQGGGGGAGGQSVGDSNGVQLNLGGGGGSGGVGTGNSGTSGSSGTGGGIIIIFAKSITLTGLIRANGGVGGNCVYPLGAGGGGAGGSIYIIVENGTFGTDKVTADGERGGCGSSGNCAGLDHRGGPGGGGRIVIKSCSQTGSVTVNGDSFSEFSADGNPTSSAGTQSLANGGQSWCYVMPSATV